jgi:hypothetical protein
MGRYSQTRSAGTPAEERHCILDLCAWHALSDEELSDELCGFPETCRRRRWAVILPTGSTSTRNEHGVTHHQARTDIRVRAPVESRSFSDEHPVKNHP